MRTVAVILVIIIAMAAIAGIYYYNYSNPATSPRPSPPRLSTEPKQCTEQIRQFAASIARNGWTDAAQKRI
jgi:flagellar basal body-associated protein FliL